MYRKPPVSDDPPPPAEFSYEGREQRQGMGVAIVQLLSLPLGIGAVLSAAFSPPIGLAGLVVSGFVVYRWFRPQPERALFRVEKGILQLRVGDAKAPLEVPLDEIENVVLDTKTVQRTIEGDSAIPAMRAIETKAGLEVDEARIMIVFVNGRRETLTKAYLPYTETSEAFGKMRVFLRKHGWLPEDERDAPLSE